MAPARVERSLRGRGRAWTLTTAAHVVPFLATAVLLVAVSPVLIPVALLALRPGLGDPGALRQPRRDGGQAAPAVRREPERMALGLLGDLVGHEARDLHARTGLVLERGRLGVWLVGEAGALLVAARRVHCWCVRVPDPALPSADRTAHLLLALREDEPGFATVANLAFSGARWRVRRRLPPAMRPALDAAAGRRRRQLRLDGVGWGPAAVRGRFRWQPPPHRRVIAIECTVERLSMTITRRLDVAPTGAYARRNLTRPPGRSWAAAGRSASATMAITG